jgi:hypothetical protein
MKKRIKEKKVRKEKSLKVQANSFGASGFTLGIVSLIFLGVFGVLFSITGFIFCFIQQKNKKTKLGKAGLIINVIAFVLSLLWIFVIAPMITQILQQSGALY